MVIASILFGLLFLINKYFEWEHKFEHGIYPGSDTLLDAGYGSNIFFGLYYVITGLHGLHIIIGVTLLSISLYLTKSGYIHAERFVVLENSGLYWHLVDLIWIFIFPFFTFGLRRTSQKLSSFLIMLSSSTPSFTSNNVFRPMVLSTVVSCIKNFNKWSIYLNQQMKTKIFYC